MDELRNLLAQSVAFPPKGLRGDWEEAIDILQPLVRNETADPATRLQALALAAILRYESGHDVEYHQLQQTFDQVAEAIRPDEWDFVTNLRQDFPHIFPATRIECAAAPSPAEKRRSPIQDYSTAAQVFMQRNSLIAGAVY